MSGVLLRNVCMFLASAVARRRVVGIIYVVLVLQHAVVYVIYTRNICDVYQVQPKTAACCTNDTYPDAEVSWYPYHLRPSASRHQLHQISFLRKEGSGSRRQHDGKKQGKKNANVKLSHYQKRLKKYFFEIFSAKNQNHKKTAVLVPAAAETTAGSISYIIISIAAAVTAAARTRGMRTSLPPR